MHKRLLIGLMGLLLLPAVQGQTPRRGRDSTYYIEGAVVDPAGRPIVHARVLLTEFGGAQYQRRSNSDGRFIFTTLTEAQYTIEVSAEGYDGIREDVLLRASSRNLRLVLHPSEPEGQIMEASKEQPVVAAQALMVPKKALKNYQKGLEAHKRKDFTRAVKHFQAAVQIHPSFGEAYTAQGVSLLHDRKGQEAFACFQKALELNPQLFDALLGMGLVLNDQRRYAEALENLQKARLLNGQKWQVHYELGRAYYGTEEFLQAAACLTEARTYRPQFPPLYLLLANALLQSDRPDEALKALEEAAKTSPEGPFADTLRDRIQALRQQRESQNKSH
jgi:tetratricopeptide (TPR) repeat protein